MPLSLASHKGGSPKDTGLGKPEPPGSSCALSSSRMTSFDLTCTLFNKVYPIVCSCNRDIYLKVQLWSDTRGGAGECLEEKANAIHCDITILPR
jgi:hypothetical protein